MKKNIALLVLCSVMFLGCQHIGQIIDIGNIDIDKIDQYVEQWLAENVTQQPPQQPQQPTNDIPATMKWLGQNYSGASITAKLISAETDGKNLYVKYEKYNWPATTVKVRVDAICCFFYDTNGWVGGKYDWWRTGGQSTKNLENVRHGYGGHKMPVRGTPIKTMIVSVDGKQRSNMIDVKWK